MEKVSIYIPAYNAEETIEKSLNSIFAQTMAFDEVIVINDFSKDNTLKIVEQYKDIKIINNIKNEGLSFCRNKGIELSRNNLVAAIDADVILDQSWLENIIKNFRDNIVMCGGSMIEKYSKNKFNEWRALYYSQNWGDNNLKNPPFLFGCNTIQKKDIWIKVNGYDVKFKTNGEDVDYSNKIRSTGFDIFYCKTSKCYHLQNDNLETLTKRVWRYHSYGYKIKNPSFLRFLKLTTKQIKFCFKRIFKEILSFNFRFIFINLIVLLNFIKFEFKNIKNKNI